MKACLVGFAALAALACFGPCLGQPLPAPPTRVGPVHAAITAAYDRINAACHRHDLGRVMSYFTPDYDEVDSQGVTSDRGQVQIQYQDWLSRVHTMQSRYVIQSLTVTPAGALVDVQAHTDGTGEKRVLLARIQGAFTSDVLVRDLWVKTPTGWRLRHRQTLSSQTHMRPR